MKQETTEAIKTFFGTTITDHILCTIDSKNLMTIGKYTLADLANAIK